MWDLSTIGAIASILALLALIIEITSKGVTKIFKFGMKKISFFHFFHLFSFNGIIDGQKELKDNLKNQIVTDLELVKNGFCGPIIKPCNNMKYRHEILSKFQSVGESLLEDYEELKITWNITPVTKSDIQRRSFTGWLEKVKLFSNKVHNENLIKVYRFVIYDSYLLDQKDREYIKLLKDIMRGDYFPFKEEFCYKTKFIPKINIPQKAIGDYALFQREKNENSKFEYKTICQYSNTKEDGILYIYFLHNNKTVRVYQSYFKELEKARGYCDSWEDLFERYEIK